MAQIFQIHSASLAAPKCRITNEAHGFKVLPVDCLLLDLLLPTRVDSAALLSALWHTLPATPRLCVPSLEVEFSRRPPDPSVTPVLTVSTHSDVNVENSCIPLTGDLLRPGRGQRRPRRRGFHSERDGDGARIMTDA